jgi:hypothetical protein
MMASTPRDFEEALMRFAGREIPAAVAEVSRGLARDILEGVVFRTPVRSGRARANWQVGLERPPEGTLDAADRDGQVTVARGAAVIARARPFERIRITNNLPYIGVLEHGSSKQAPRGIVAATLASLAARKTI